MRPFPVRNHSWIVPAAATLWAMFSLWMLAPHVSLSPTVGRAAATLMTVELVALLAWSYGSENCDPGGCAPFSEVAGVAARTDVPVLAAVLVLLAAVDLRRRSRLDRTEHPRDSMPKRA
jgi:hypothetical protein